MSSQHRHHHPAAPPGLVARLRLWSQLWHRYASGAHLDVTGADAVHAVAASRRAARYEGEHFWRLEA